MVDITTSLFVALFFACSDLDSQLDISGLDGEKGEDGLILVIFPSFSKPDDIRSTNILCVFDQLKYENIDSPMLPHSLSKRIVMQESYFYVTKDISPGINFHGAYS